jgi:hypothetical protein
MAAVYVTIAEVPIKISMSFKGAGNVSKIAVSHGSLIIIVNKVYSV